MPNARGDGWLTVLHTPDMDPELLAAAAAGLRDAERTRAPIAALTATYPELAVEDAYEIQLINIRQRLEDGGIIRGHKVGLTAQVMQEMLGVDEPDYGHLVEDMFFSSEADVRADRFLQPRVEVEIAFRLQSPLVGPGITIDDVLAATEVVAPSIEIIDSRIADWKITLADTIADNASSAGVVIGPWLPLANTLHLDAVSVDLVKNGQVAASGKGTDVMGHPAAAVAWLANKLSALEITLDAGHVVMPGSCTKAITVAAGDHIRAEFSELGDVSVVFT